jgi:oligoribonuclease NrnB/cAMP/cGMP phosphodiesterase (DHH superfamily)
MVSTKIIYHKGCIDGIMAAGAAFGAFGENAEYIPMSYSDILDVEQFKGCRVHILDFSFKKPVFDALNEVAHAVVLIDHHKTAFEELGYDPTEVVMSAYESPVIYLDAGRSGALLASLYYHGVGISEVIRHVDDRDRWQFKLAGTREINASLYAMRLTPETAWEVMQQDNTQLLYEGGKLLLQEHDARVAVFMKTAVMSTDVCGNEIAIVNCPYYLVSDVGNQLCEREHIDYAMMFSIDLKEGLVNYSLRSVGNVDVSGIAKCYGGGGHKNAAGFTLKLKEDTLLSSLIGK